MPDRKKALKPYGDKALSEMLLRVVYGLVSGNIGNDIKPKSFVSNLSDVLTDHEQAVILQTLINSKLALDFVAQGEYKAVHVVSDQELNRILQNNKIMPILYDENYAIMPDRMAFKIFQSDVLDIMEYISDFFDCDNYAFLFSSICSAQFLVNSVGVCFGKLINASTKEFIGYHAFNIVPVVSTSNGSITLYLFEPQTGEYTTVDNPVLGNIEYVPIMAEFY